LVFKCHSERSECRRHRDCVKTNTSGFVIPTKVGRRLDSARIQFMFAGFGSPLFPKGRLRRAGMTPRWTFHTVSMASPDAKPQIDSKTESLRLCSLARDNFSDVSNHLIGVALRPFLKYNLVFFNWKPRSYGYKGQQYSWRSPRLVPTQRVPSERHHFVSGNRQDHLLEMALSSNRITVMSLQPLGMRFSGGVQGRCC
jgi:hypothetical protein